MFALYAFLVAVALTVLSYIFVKTFQLENYRLDRYLKKAAKLDFAFGRKTPLVFTKRIKRLFFCIFLLNFCVFLLFFGLIPLFWVNFALAALALIFLPLWVTLGFAVASPVENFIKKIYIKKAQKKLLRLKTKVVAITGSYGKTSTKNILQQILNEEFACTASPKSYNTPMGVCKTILENLKETDDFLILEFGARRKGDIEELAKLAPVDFGIITPIGNCHLETFGSLQTLEDTKYELCENTKELVIFNGKSSQTRKLYDRFARKKYLVCQENSFAFAKDVTSSNCGSTFTLVLDGTEVFCNTKLLGRANIDNIVVAAAMAYLLGESCFSIQRGIEKLKPTPHRLELIKGFVNVLDDSYNSNLDGFKQALEVLSGFEGRKIVVSPGLVELGHSQYEANLTVGQEVARVADVFLIMNETNKKSLTDGAAGGTCKIMYASTRDEQKKILKEILKAGDCVLFENDLPDNLK